MSYIFAVIAVPVIIGLVAWAFVSTEPKSIINFLRYFFPVIFLASGIVLTIIGRGAYGIPAFMLGLLWWWDIRRRIRMDSDQ